MSIIGLFDLDLDQMIEGRMTAAWTKVLGTRGTIEAFHLALPMIKKSGKEQCWQSNFIWSV